jgi:SAM-dependent methyltransferase
MATADTPNLSSDFWEARYQEGSSPWDLGQPAPGFQTWVQQQTPNGERLLVLGCGRGHDALLFAQSGFDVVGVDYAATAIAAATAAAEAQNLPARFLQRDIFDLLPEFADQFDFVAEHTCFCAIDPGLRDRYGDLVHGLLKPGGQLIGVFFTHQRPGGPPFGTTPDEVRQRFGRRLTLQSLTPVLNSIPRRAGEEHFGIFQKGAP